MDDRKLPEPNKYYSASAIINEGFLGDWVKSKSGFIQLLKTERGQEVFEPIIKQGKYMSFKIKGQKVLDVMKLIEAGELRL